MNEATTTNGGGVFSAMAIGTKVLLVLGVLTAVEYIIAISNPLGQIPLIFAIAVAKAGLILVYFMHVKQIWDEDQT